MHKYLLLLLVSTPGFAGLVVSAGLTHGTDKGTLKQYFQNSNARVDFKFKSSDGSFIIHGLSGDISWVDHPRKTYLQVNKADLDRIASIITAFNKQPATPAPTDIKVQKDAKPQTVGPWTCTRYDILNKAKNTGHFCVVPMEAVGASPSDYRALQSLIDSISKTGLVPAAERGMLDVVDRALKLGFIVQSAEAQGGTMQVEKVTKQTLKEPTFAAPAGYTRTDITTLLQKQMMKASGK